MGMDELKAELTAAKTALQRAVNARVDTSNRHYGERAEMAESQSAAVTRLTELHAEERATMKELHQAETKTVGKAVTDTARRVGSLERELAVQQAEAAAMTPAAQ